MRPQQGHPEEAPEQVLMEEPHKFGNYAYKRRSIALNWTGRYTELNWPVPKLYLAWRSYCPNRLTKVPVPFSLSRKGLDNIVKRRDLVQIQIQIVVW